MIEDFYRIKRLPPYVFAEVNALKARAQLHKTQRADGGWGWRLDEDSDALGTGLALYALAASGVGIGLLVALFTAGALRNRPIARPPLTTAFGGLYHHVTQQRMPGQSFGPTNINFGLLPRMEVRAKKRERKRMMAERADGDFQRWWAELDRAAA